MAASRDAVQGSLEDHVVFESMDLGDASPAHGHVLHEDVVVGRAVGQDRVDSDAGGDPSSPRTPGHDDLFDLEGGAREEPDAALPPPAERVEGLALAGEGVLTVEAIDELGRNAAKHRLPVGGADL